MDLPTYDEAITLDQGTSARTRIAPGVQNVLHHIDYSSDPEEARIHFELTSPPRCTRSQDRHASPQRLKRRSSPEHHGVSHYHYCQGDIKVRQSPWMTENTVPHVRLKQSPGGDDGSSSGDEGNSISGRSPGGQQLPNHQQPEAPRRGMDESPDGDPGDNGSPGNGRHPSR